MHEFELIKKYFSKLSQNCPSSLNLNDDVFFNKTNKIVVSIDTYIEGKHFVNFKNPDESMMLQRLSILNAYYAPEIFENQFYENITPVNSFRIIFNEYFNGNYKILEDRNYWNHGDAPWDFHDVTEIIGNK